MLRFTDIIKDFSGPDGFGQACYPPGSHISPVPCGQERPLILAPLGPNPVGWGLAEVPASGHWWPAGSSLEGAGGMGLSLCPWLLTHRGRMLSGRRVNCTVNPLLGCFWLSWCWGSFLPVL